MWNIINLGGISMQLMTIESAKKFIARQQERHKLNYENVCIITDTGDGLTLKEFETMIEEFASTIDSISWRHVYITINGHLIKSAYYHVSPHIIKLVTPLSSVNVPCGTF